MAEPKHQPVLLDSAVKALSIQSSGVYIDATFGRGGHARAILDQLGPEGRLLAFDQDPAARQPAQLLSDSDARLTFLPASFARMQACLQAQGVTTVDGVLFDLGVSSPQFDVAERGFSFRHAGPLDMRMDPQTGPSLADWLAEARHGDIAHVIKTLGEEPMAGRIASAIIAARDNGDLTDTARLAAIIKQAIPARVAAQKKIHPATQTFQALRMHINDELGALDAGLQASLQLLKSGGRLVVISFHSLEDRRVKRFMRHQARPPQPALPMVAASDPALSLIGKPVTPDAQERCRNPRARSAIMRVAERTTAAEVLP